jgi:hydrogenase maturation protease
MTKERDASIIVLGYGNPGRVDDGLGPAFGQAIEDMGIDGVSVEAGYQLTVEDAKTIASYDVVIFVDATMDGPEPFRFERVRPDFAMGFSSHRIMPPAVLALACGIFGAKTKGYLLGIRGCEFRRFGEELTARAVENLRAALEFLVPVLRTGAKRKELVEASQKQGAGRSAATRLCHV